MHTNEHTAHAVPYLETPRRSLHKGLLLREKYRLLGCCHGDCAKLPTAPMTGSRVC